MSDNMQPTDEILDDESPDAKATEAYEEVEEFEVPAHEEEGIAAQAQDDGQNPVGEPVAALPKKKYGKACLPNEPGSATSNQTLIKWLPGKLTIEDLRNASKADKVHELVDGAKVRVAYQTERPVTWNGSTENLCGRTLEEDFGLENPEWSQAAAITWYRRRMVITP